MSNRIKKIWYGLLTHYAFLVLYIVIRLIVLLPFGIVKIALEEFIQPCLKYLTPCGIKDVRKFYQEMHAHYKYICEMERSNNNDKS